MSKHLRPARARTRATVTALALLGAGVAALLAHADDAPGPPPSVLTQLAPLQKGSMPLHVTLYGSVQASARAQQTIMAPAAAEVAAIGVRLGEAVPAGKALMQLAPTPASVASYAQARSALDVAEQALERTRSLLQQHLATAQQLDDARKSAADARATLDSLRAEGAGGTLTVRAPFASTVTALSVSVGTLVGQGSALLQLVRPQGLILLAGAVPQSAASIRVGDDVSITAIGAASALQGKVLLRGEVVDPGSGLVPIEITVPAGSLLPGEQGVASVTTGQVEAYLVPHEAMLLDDEGNPYVVQVVGGIAKKVDVRVLGMQDGRDAIAGALTPSAPVALSGNYQLEDGMKVRTAADAGRARQ